MNSLLRCCTVAAGALSLAACASQGQMRYQPVATPAPQQESFQQDAAYIQTVERIARQRGVSVKWVNPPLKRVAASTAAADME